MKKLLLPVAFCLLSVIAYAYPITPRPLRKLVIESEYIIHGLVIKAGSEKNTNKKKEYDDSYRYFALVVVKEVWQGKLNTDTLKIYYPANLICPAPPQYIENAEAVIFLDGPTKQYKDFSTHALSYGVKNGLDREGIAVYKQRIKEMQSILKMDDGLPKDQHILDWLVSCAGNKYTRWEGTYELSPGSDFMSYYDRTDISRKESLLSASQHRVLFDAFMKVDSFNYQDIGLIDIAMGINDSLLLIKLKKVLGNIPAESLWQAEVLMDRIVTLTGDTQLEKLQEEFKEIYFSTDKEARCKELFQLFIQQMKQAGLKKPIYAASGDNVG